MKYIFFHFFIFFFFFIFQKIFYKKKKKKNKKIWPYIDITILQPSSRPLPPPRRPACGFFRAASIRNRLYSLSSRLSSPLWRWNMKEFERKQAIADLRLTDLQKSFCEHYVEHFNVLRAVRESGSLSANTTQIGTDMMRNPSVVSYIEILKSYAADRVDLRLDRVLKELMRIGFSRMDHFVSWDKKTVVLKSSDELSEDDLAAVSEVVQVDTKDGAKIRVKLHSKQAALEKLLGYVESQEEGKKAKGAGTVSSSGPKQLTINNVTVRGMLMDPKARGAFETLSNQVFGVKGMGRVPKMSEAMMKQIDALTGAKLVDYVGAGEADGGEADGGEVAEDMAGEAVIDGACGYVEGDGGDV
jgi:phage terminase small subunit